MMNLQDTCKAMSECMMKYYKKKYKNDKKTLPALSKLLNSCSEIVIDYENELAYKHTK